MKGSFDKNLGLVERETDRQTYTERMTMSLYIHVCTFCTTCNDCTWWACCMFKFLMCNIYSLQ